MAELTDPFGVGQMGITAENLAEKRGITREEQDALATESHRRAAGAIADEATREHAFFAPRRFRDADPATRLRIASVPSC